MMAVMAVFKYSRPSLTQSRRAGRRLLQTLCKAGAAERDDAAIISENSEMMPLLIPRNASPRVTGAVPCAALTGSCGAGAPEERCHVTLLGPSAVGYMVT